MICIENLTKQFTLRQSAHISNLFLLGQKNIVTACRNINLTIQKGEILGLVGPNASGKTTLLRILCGVILPDGGHLLTKSDLTINAVLGDHTNFYRRLTGRENLELFASFYGLDHRRQQKRIAQVAELLELSDHLDKVFQENSAGIKQRFTLARGLLREADLYLLDEPMKNLDTDISQRMRYYIKNELGQEQKKTIVVTSHHLSEIAEMADRIAILKQGELRACATMDQLARLSGCADQNVNIIYHFFIT